MLVLHAGFLDEELLVWGEMPPATGKVHSRFASRYNLKAALAEAGSFPRGEANGSGRVDGRVVAWLPTALEHAVPSTTLIAPEGKLGPGPDKLAAYSAEAVAFDAPSMLALVRACAGQSLLAPGLAIGRDLAYWPRLARFAAMLVVERRYVPSLEAARIGRRAAYRARWRPRLDAAGRAELTMLAMAMPGAFRALGRDADGPPLHDPLEVARQFVDAVADHLVRTAAGRVVRVKRRTINGYAHLKMRILISRRPRPEFARSLRKSSSGFGRPPATTTRTIVSARASKNRSAIKSAGRCAICCSRMPIRACSSICKPHGRHRDYGGHFSRPSAKRPVSRRRSKQRFVQRSRPDTNSTTPARMHS
jgi:hypothetical protein